MSFTHTEAITRCCFYTHATLALQHSHRSCQSAIWLINQSAGSRELSPGTLLHLCVYPFFFSEKPRICGIYVTETSCTHRPNLQKYSSACIFYFEGLCVFFMPKNRQGVCCLSVSWLSPCCVDIQECPSVCNMFHKDVPLLVFSNREKQMWPTHVPLTPHIIFPRRRRNSCPAVECAHKLYPLKKNLIRGPRQGHQKADMSWHTFRGQNHPHFSSHCVQEGLMCNTVAQRCTCTRATTHN